MSPQPSLTNFMKKSPFKASPERGGGPLKAVEEFLNPSATADTLISHFPFLIQIIQIISNLKKRLTQILFCGKI